MARPIQRRQSRTVLIPSSASKSKLRPRDCRSGLLNGLTWAKVTVPEIRTCDLKSTVVSALRSLDTCGAGKAERSPRTGNSSMECKLVE